MRLFDDFKNLFDSNGNIRANVWVEWQHEITTQGHCGICLVLDKCWFDNNFMPPIPLHFSCHCTKKYISPPIANITSNGVLQVIAPFGLTIQPEIKVISLPFF